MFNSFGTPAAFTQQDLTLTQWTNTGPAKWIARASLPPAPEARITCPLCPHHQLVHDEARDREWNNLIKKDWFHLTLAEDWVRLLILAPLTHAPAHSVSTHCMLPTRLRIIDNGPSLDKIRSVLSTRVGGWSENLATAFHHTLPHIPGLDAHKPAFWDFVARFAQVTDLGGTVGCRRSHCTDLLRFSWTEREGFTVSPTRNINGEQAIK
jgi:hypothetical protein